MRRISTDKIEAGMILAKPLFRGAMVILGEGTVLTESWISRIEDMDVTQIFIEGAPEQTMPVEAALEQLDRRFQNVLDRPHMEPLKNIVREHIEGLYGG